MGDENLNMTARMRMLTVWDRSKGVLLDAADIGILLNRNSIDDLDRIENLVAELEDFAAELKEASEGLGEEDE